MEYIQIAREREARGMREHEMRYLVYDREIDETLDRIDPRVEVSLGESLAELERYKYVEWNKVTAVRPWLGLVVEDAMVNRSRRYVEVGHLAVH